MLTRRRSWKWSLCQQGTCVGSKISDCLGCAWKWARRGQAILPDPELIQALKLQTQELQGNYSLSQGPPGPSPASGTLHTSSRPACPSSLCSVFCGLVLSGQARAKPMTHFLQFYPTPKLQGESCWISKPGHQPSLQSWSLSTMPQFTCEHSWSSLVEML